MFEHHSFPFHVGQSKAGTAEATAWTEPGDGAESAIASSLSANHLTTRPYQVEALHALSREFAYRDNLLLALPVGAGKTLVAAKWIVDHVVQKGGKVIWVAHRRELLEQAYNTFVRLLPLADASSITWWTAGHAKSANGKIVLVSIAATRNFPPIQADLLVIDEAHHEPAATYQRLRERIRCKKHLGLTATPHRLDQKKLGYEAIVYQRSFMSLVEEGWLARPTPVLPKTGLSFTLAKTMDDFSDETLAQLDHDKRNQFIVDHWQANAQQYGKTLVFAVNRTHARRLVEAFRRTVPGITAEYIVSSDTPAVEREAIVQRFRAGDIQVLVNCRIFTEGFDCPDVRTIFITRPTLSATLYLQMVGRGTRITDTKKAFYLVDFLDNLGRFQEQLITRWVLQEDQPEERAEAPEQVYWEQDTESGVRLPQWVQKEIQMSDVEIRLIAGYVEYEYERGKQEGFLVYGIDESAFLKAWNELEEKPGRQSEAEVAKSAIDAYTTINPTRLSLQHIMLAWIALSKGRAQYVPLSGLALLQELRAFPDRRVCVDGRSEESATAAGRIVCRD